MLKKYKFILLSCLFLVLSVLVIAQETMNLLLFELGEITAEETFIPYNFTLSDTAIVSITMMPTGESALEPLIVLLDKNGIIIAESRADDISSISELSIPLAEGDYTVIASRGDELSTGGFNLQANIDDDSANNLPDMSDERLEALGYPDIEVNERAKWTIFAYYGADSNLEESLVNDFDEFERGGGSDEDVRVLVLLDRHLGYFADDADDWSGTRLYEVGEDSLSEVIINTEALVQFDELDMGDPETLAAFLVWGVRHYPAEHYVMTFGSHGAGWRGIVTDESNGNSSLSLNNLRQAFDTVKAATGVERFDMLVNDACLMASIEYYDVMQEYFQYSIGSAELVTNPALDMSTLTEALRGQDSGSDINLRDIGRQLVDLYINRDSVASSPIRNYTSAMTNLATFEEFNASLDVFAQVINSDPRRYIPTLTQARANTYTYNRLFGATEQIDLGDFMAQVILASDFEVLSLAAGDVVEELAKIHVYGNAGDFAIERTSYYNIYFPLSRGDLNEYFSQSRLDEWQQMLTNYFAYSRYEVWTDDNEGVPFHEPQTPQINITELIPQYPIASFNLPLALNIEVQATNVARATFYAEQILDEETTLRILTSPIFQEIEVPYDVRPLRNQNVWRSGVDQRTFSWNAGGYEIIGENESHIEFLQKSFDESDAFFLEGRYRSAPEEQWSDVKVTFTSDTNYEFSLRSSTFININRATGTFGVFDPIPGSQLQVYRTEVDLDDGDTDIIEEGNIYTIGEDGLGANLVPLETGDYILRFQIEAFGQDIEEDSIYVRVENNDVNPQLRGQNLIEEFGFSVNIPARWVGNFTAQPGYISTDTIISPLHEDNPYREPIFIRIYYYPGIHNLEQVRERVVNVLGRPEHPITYTDADYKGDQRLIEFSYVLENRYVHALATYVEARDMSMVFIVDDPSVSPELADQLFADFIDSLTFHEDVSSCDVGKWCFEEISSEQSVAIPSDWVAGLRSETRWVDYRKADDANLGVAFDTLEDSEIDLEDYARETISELDFGDNSPRTYTGENHTWESIQYNISHDGLGYIGRLYRTVANESSYIVRVEAPESEAHVLYETVLHPLIDSIIIEDLYYEVDWLETVGLSFEVPNPVLDDNPYLPARKSSATDVEIAYFSSPYGDEELEIFFVPSVSLDNATFWFNDYWDRQNHIVDITDFVTRELDGQRVIEFNLELTIDDIIWTGRYFAVHNDADEMLYIIGGRELENAGRDVEGAYEHLLESMRFQFGNFDLYTSIHNRPLFDEQYAIELDVWQFSEPMEVSRNIEPQVDRLTLHDDQFSIEVYFIENLSDNLEEDLARLPVFAESELTEFEWKSVV